VDDEDGVRQVICDLIRTDGYRVTGVPGGDEALAEVRKAPVDLVLTDLMMPGMSGWQLLRTLKQQNPKRPVVLLTGYITEEGESLLTRAEFDGYLVKPVDHDRLRVLLRALLYPHNLGRAAEVVAIDDDRGTLRLIDTALSKRGLFVETYADTGEAVQRIRKKSPDLILTDLGLPGMNGLDLCHRWRSDPDTCLVPILILTSSPTRENVLRAIDLGIEGFVAKPFNPKELGDKVIQALRMSVTRT
jgi:CheY-like chemotaxis protein